MLDAARRVFAELERNPQVQALAEQLARDPRFQRAKNQTQKRYAAELTLGVDAQSDPTKLGVIITKASTINDVLRPGRAPRK